MNWFLIISFMSVATNAQNPVLIHMDNKDACVAAMISTNDHQSSLPSLSMFKDNNPDINPHGVSMCISSSGEVIHDDRDIESRKKSSKYSNNHT